MAARRLSVVTKKDQQRAPDLREAVRESAAAMDFLTDADKAMRALAERLAQEIEQAVDRADELAALQRDAAGDLDVYKRLKKLEAMCSVTKTVGWLGPQLQGVLRDLGGAPAARKALKADKPIGGRLAQLRADTQAGS
jgi:ABC-type transporter Mla subunit MlaD